MGGAIQNETSGTEIISVSASDRVLFYGLFQAASVYVVRKVRAALKQAEQTEQPVLTPCSLAKGKKERYASDAALMAAPEPEGAAGLSASTETAVQECGS